MNILVNVRYYGGTYIARALKMQASSTTSQERAAEAVARKILGNHQGDELRLMRLNDSQFMADVTKLEGFTTLENDGSLHCCKCGAEHRLMFRRARGTYDSGCAIRERTRWEERRAA